MINNQIFFFFYNLAHQSAFFDKLVVFIADTFPYIVILLAGLFLIFYLPAQAGFKISVSKNILKDLINKWREFSLVFFSVVLATLTALVLKHSIHTLRPFLSLPNVHALFSETGYAFPSGHATAFSALAFSIFFINKKVGYAFMFFALLIGLARITAGVHFPVDILGGFILGGGMAYFVKFILKKFFNLQLSL